jgi:hypothetical protein
MCVIVVFHKDWVGFVHRKIWEEQEKLNPLIPLQLPTSASFLQVRLRNGIACLAYLRCCIKWSRWDIFSQNQWSSLTSCPESPYRVSWTGFPKWCTFRTRQDYRNSTEQANLGSQLDLGLLDSNTLSRSSWKWDQIVVQFPAIVVKPSVRREFVWFREDFGVPMHEGRAHRHDSLVKNTIMSCRARFWISTYPSGNIVSSDLSRGWLNFSQQANGYTMAHTKRLFDDSSLSTLIQ